MALREQPYLPLYVQDFLTDEKLMLCSAETTGVYIRLMCVMHKSEEYGVILLRQKEQQTGSTLLDFAGKLARFMPYHVETIHSALVELIDEGVLDLDGQRLTQKRMVKDCRISDLRAQVGAAGGKEAAKKRKQFAIPKPLPNDIANSENENEYENESKNKDKGGVKKKFSPPSLKEMEDYFRENGYTKQHAKKAFDYYTAGNWIDSKDQQVRNWKQKCHGVWFRDEGKIILQQQPGQPMRDLSKDPTILKRMKELEIQSR